jgi:hypothetical protein
MPRHDVEHVPALRYHQRSYQYQMKFEAHFVEDGVRQSEKFHSYLRADQSESVVHHVWNAGTGLAD